MVVSSYLEKVSKESMSRYEHWKKKSTISNGFCTFNPTSRKGKWFFVLQIAILSFTPLLILVVQNSIHFNNQVAQQEQNLEKAKLVDEVTNLIIFINDLQTERASVCFALFVSIVSQDSWNFTKDFLESDNSLVNVKWRPFGHEKILSTKLRFQIRLDDFREYVTRAISEGIVDENTIEEVLNFYNMAITSILSAMATEIGKAQSPNNWRLIMTAYNMIKIVDSAGIGLVYGLRYYGNGKLKPDEIIPYVQHHGLLWAYYRKVIEIVPKDLKSSLEAMYRGSDFKTLRDSAKTILKNNPIPPDHQKGVKYFWECQKFTLAAKRLLDVLTVKIRLIRNIEVYHVKLANAWGIFILILILLIIPFLVFMARNVIWTFQLFASSLESRAKALKKQQDKQNKLIYKMLPRLVVEKLKSGEDVIETFESASLFFSSLVGFASIMRSLNPFEVIKFLNGFYEVFDDLIDQYDCSKVESISDSYLVASGIPRANGERHASELCSMALNFLKTASTIQRPDQPSQNVQIKAGIHSGTVVAGIVGSKLPRYCLFGDTVNTASRMQSQSLPGKVQISSETKLMLDVMGGFLTEERGAIYMKGKGRLNTFWLMGEME